MPGRDKRVFRGIPSHRQVFAKDGYVQLVGKGRTPAQSVRVEDRLSVACGPPPKIVDITESGSFLIFTADVERCSVASQDATSGIIVDRQEAFHGIYRHYWYPNLSICRFSTVERADYGADTVFEIDVHDDIIGRVPLSFFYRYVRAAVTVGLRIFLYLTGPLGIDPRYITLSISRMGCRVSVDWRAFGPRRLHQILAVIRYIESQVFAEEELTDLAGKFSVPKIKIDAGFYERSDLPREGVDESNAFKGPWLRPVGALHSESGLGGWFYRITPVPRERFHPDYTEWLVKESRGPDENWKGWPDRELPDGFMLTVPESRNPKIDAVIEADPNPAWKLIELFECEDLVNQIPDRYRDDVIRARQRCSGSRIHSPRERQITADVVERVVNALGVDYREKHNLYEMDCPRAVCKQRGKTAVVFKDSGVFHCFRCATDCLSLVALAAERGLSHLIPTRVQSSKPVDVVPVADVPVDESLTDWGLNVEVIEETFESPEELWAHRRQRLELFKERKDVRIFNDASDLGSGKTRTAGEFLGKQGKRSRTLVARDEAKQDYLAAISDAIPVQGRRPGINCNNEALDEVLGRREPVAKYLCPCCPDQDRCEYKEQFENTNDHSLVLTHGHGSTAHFDIFTNESEIDVVDEDALSVIAQHDDLDFEELDRFKIRFEYDFDDEEELDCLRTCFGYGDNDRFDATADVDVRRCAATSTLDTIISRLQALLTSDAVVNYSVQVGRDAELVDLDLARFLLRDQELRNAVAALGDDDIKEHEAARKAIIRGWQDELAGNKPILGYVYPKRFETEWLNSTEREKATSSGDPLAELMAWIDWRDAHLVPIKGKRDSRIQRRPKDIIEQLRDALETAYYMEKTGSNRPLALQAFRPLDAGSWILRLTTRRPFLSNSQKIIHLSATAVPERLRLLYGPPKPGQKWIVYIARLARRERRIVIADRSYSASCILQNRNKSFQAGLLETVDKLIESEQSRTKLPVAVIGASKIIEWYLKHRLGKKVASGFKMPIQGQDREERIEALKQLTLPYGFISHYAYAVSGLNTFSIEENGVKRFVRSLIVLGNVIPNLTGVARFYRGLFAGVRDTAIVWTQTYRTVAFAGTEKDGRVTAAKNVVGYRDDVANAILHGIYQGELLQITGRMRGQLPDPIDPTIVPTVYVIAGVAIPGWEVDEVIGLNDLRQRLGLEVKEQAKTGRPSRKSLEEQITDRWNKRGATATMLWLVRGLFPKYGAVAVTHARIFIQGAGHEPSHAVITAGVKEVNRLVGRDPDCATSE